MYILLYRYDVILTAETIYNTENYSKLHDVFKTTLAEDGIVYPLLQDNVKSVNAV